MISFFFISVLPFSLVDFAEVGLSQYFEALAFTKRSLRPVLQLLLACLGEYYRVHLELTRGETSVRFVTTCCRAQELSSVAEFFPRKHKALDLVLSAGRKKDK